MQGLNNLIKQGKVLYLGISDTPAWIVSKANQYARDHGLAQFVIYQGTSTGVSNLRDSRSGQANGRWPNVIWSARSSKCAVSHFRLPLRI
jgi:aryl-alcohol dehydrogenase-like predicted oxidoreductase